MGFVGWFCGAVLHWCGLESLVSKSPPAGSCAGRAADWLLLYFPRLFLLRPHTGSVIVVCIFSLPMQVSHVLFEVLKIPPPPSARDLRAGGFSTGQEVSCYLHLALPGHAVWRRAAKELSCGLDWPATFAASVRDSTGRFLLNCRCCWSWPRTMRLPASFGSTASCAPCSTGAVWGGCCVPPAGCAGVAASCADIWRTRSCLQLLFGATPLVACPRFPTLTAGLCKASRCTWPTRKRWPTRGACS